MDKFWTITVTKGDAEELASLLRMRFGAHGGYISWETPRETHELLAIYIPKNQEKEFLILMDNDIRVVWIQDYNRDDDIAWN